MALPVPVPAKTRKGEKFLNQAKTAELSKKYDEALDLIEQAMSEDPTDPAYQMVMRRVRFQAAQHHVDVGEKLRAGGKLEEALAEFERAYAIDPASSIAEQEIRQTRGMIERNRKKEVAPEDSGLTPAQRAKKATLEKIERAMPVPELKPLSSRPIDLKMNNQPPKVLFETLGKLAGVNVIFDPEAPATSTKNLSIEFNGATLEEALDHLATMTKSFWKPLSSNTIFVTQDNTTKRRDYEDQVVKVFYLNNVNTPQELQEIATDIRSICDIRRLFTYNAQMAIIVRAEADRVALAEKVIQDLDKPKSEVVIDILVMEANVSKERDLATTVAAGGINSPITFIGSGATTTTTTPSTSTSNSSTNSTNSTTNTTTPTTTTTTTPPNASAGSITLNRLVHLSTGQYSVTLPNGLLQAVINNSATRVLQSPQVRVADSFKATVKIGDKIPTASGSFQPGIGGVGINPLVNTQFQFIDVGVNVDITPKIHYASNEVSLHVELDISNERGRIDLGGISQPIIGQRKVTFDVRLKEGEANILGGLVQRQETKTTKGVPGLASIPLLGRLFSEEVVTRDNSELLFALIPHIVRAPEITEQNLRGISTGSDTVVKLTYAPRRGAPEAAPSAPGEARKAETPKAEAPRTTLPPPAAAAPVTLPPATAPPAAPVTAPPPSPPATAPPTPGAPAPGRIALSFQPARVEAQVGAAVSVNLTVENAADLFTAPFRIKFDPKIVQLTSVTAGNFFSTDGQNMLPMTKNVMNDTGEASIGLSRLPGSGGIGGSGTLATFTFQAVAKGETKVSVQDPALRTSKLEEIGAAASELSITVK